MEDIFLPSSLFSETCSSVFLSFSNQQGKKKFFTSKRLYVLRTWCRKGTHIKGGRVHPYSCVAVYCKIHTSESCNYPVSFLLLTWNFICLLKSNSSYELECWSLEKNRPRIDETDTRFEKDSSFLRWWKCQVKQSFLWFAKVDKYFCQPAKDKLSKLDPNTCWGYVQNTDWNV